MLRLLEQSVDFESDSDQAGAFPGGSSKPVRRKRNLQTDAIVPGVRFDHCTTLLLRLVLCNAVKLLERGVIADEVGLGLLCRHLRDIAQYACDPVGLRGSKMFNIGFEPNSETAMRQQLVIAGLQEDRNRLYGWRTFLSKNLRIDPDEAERMQDDIYESTRPLVKTGRR